MGKNKKYYKKNYYHNNNNKKKETSNNKVTYESLMNAEMPEDVKVEEDLNKLLIIKYIAISVVIFAIIIGTLIAFRHM